MTKKDKKFLNIFGIVLTVFSFIAFVGVLFGHQHQAVVCVFFGIAAIISFTGNDEQY